MNRVKYMMSDECEDFIATEYMFSCISVGTLASSHIMMKEERGALNTVNLTLPLALFKGR